MLVLHPLRLFWGPKTPERGRRRPPCHSAASAKSPSRGHRSRRWRTRKHAPCSISFTRPEGSSSNTRAQKQRLYGSPIQSIDLPHLLRSLQGPPHAPFADVHDFQFRHVEPHRHTVEDHVHVPRGDILAPKFALKRRCDHHASFTNKFNHGDDVYFKKAHDFVGQSWCEWSNASGVRPPSTCERWKGCACL